MLGLDGLETSRKGCAEGIRAGRLEARLPDECRDLIGLG